MVGLLNENVLVWQTRKAVDGMNQRQFELAVHAEWVLRFLGNGNPVNDVTELLKLADGLKEEIQEYRRVRGWDQDDS